jgi:alanyl-tRNA synthetase
MTKQKDRSRKASEVVSGDWTELSKTDKISFVGYDSLESKSHVVKYRKQKAKEKEIFQLVLDRTPFYAESGGQVGDKGKLIFGNEEIEVLDTKKENELIIHFVNRFPSNIDTEVLAKVDESLRADTMNNHTANPSCSCSIAESSWHSCSAKGFPGSAGNIYDSISHISQKSPRKSWMLLTK